MIIRNIQLARQTIEITERGSYDYNGSTVSLDPFDKYDFARVEVLSPDTLAALAAENKSSDVTRASRDCKFRIVNADSFAAARQLPDALVMNFANAHVPGGGFLNGAVAQEEALCRNSTLYLSISSVKARDEMYAYNITHPSACYSDYMLLSPDVCVFRDENNKLLPAPFICAVMTCPAPNRNGSARLVSQSRLDRVMTDRLEKYLAAAAQKGYRNLVLGAWGCGAFGHNAKNVAKYFYSLFFDECGKKDFFDNVVFAVMERNPKAPKISAFREVFGENAEYCDNVSQIVAD